VKFLLEHSLRDDTTRKLLEWELPLVAAIEEYYRSFQNGLWTADDVKMSPHQAFLSMHSFMTWTAAVRMALSGQCVVIGNPDAADGRCDFGFGQPFRVFDR